MRFSLVHLLLVFPAWALAYLAAPLATFEVARVTYQHDATAGNIRGIRLWAAWQEDENPNIKFEEFDTTQLWADMGTDCDSWGNPYQFVERNERGIYDMPSSFHVFSFGADGKSETDGNDPDDINSWNYNRGKYYGRMIANDLRREYFWRTLWLTPIIYPVIWFVVHTFRVSHRIARNE